MTSIADTPLAELLLARGLVGQPLLGEALAHVRASRDTNPHLSLAIFLLQRGVLPAAEIEGALRHLGGEASPGESPPAFNGFGHVSTLEDAPPAIEASQAQQLGPYRLLRKLAEGGMGAVYEVEHEAMEGRFALKTIKAEACELLGDDALARLKREARLSAEIDHPQVVRVHAAEFEGPVPYLVQDLLVGGSLQGRVERSGRLTPEATVELGVLLAEGLAAAHAAKILHRDLKPDNVLFNDRDQPVIVDFGLSRRVGLNSIQLTQTGEILGTPAYMAPEQAIDTTQAREPADVYGLGAVLYFALEGRSPFLGQTVLETLSLVLTADPPRAEHAPSGLASLIVRLLAKEPSERPLAADLGGLLRESIAPAKATTPWPLLLGGLALALLAGGLAAFGSSQLGASSGTPGASPSATAPSSAGTPTPMAEARAERLEALAERLSDLERPFHVRASAALDLLRLAPEHPESDAARKVARKLKREPLATLPLLDSHRGLAFLSPTQIAGATKKTLYTLDLEADHLKWVETPLPPGRLPSRVAAVGGQAWLSLALPQPTLFDLNPARAGETLTLRPAWRLNRASLVALGLSPSGRWAVAGGSADLVLYDLTAREAVAHLRLPFLSGIHDVQVEWVSFVDEERFLVVLNQRSLEKGEEDPRPWTGELFLLRRTPGGIVQVGVQPLGFAGFGLGVGAGEVYSSGDGGGLSGFSTSDFAAPPERLEARALGNRRVVGIAVLAAGDLLTCWDLSEGVTHRSELGRWSRRGGAWSYAKIAVTDRVRSLTWNAEGRLALTSYRQSSRLKRLAGQVWFAEEASQ